MNVDTFEHTDVEELALVLDNVLEIDVVGVLTLVDFEVDTLVGILTLRYFRGNSWKPENMSCAMCEN